MVIGATGGIGHALVNRLKADGHNEDVVAFSRSTGLDLQSEASIADAARTLSGLGPPVRLVIDATGILSDHAMVPERALAQIDPDQMARAFAINAIGPALLLKHFLPLLPRKGRAVFATLSAKVGSIGDNRLGGWYSYRASKAALNQIVHSAAIELRRRCPDAICVALHPGTVDTALSRPFAKAGLAVRLPDQAARDILDVVERLPPDASGGFFDWRGVRLPW